MIPIIMFAGKAGSGKDTACQELATLLEGPLGVVAQADPMKRCIRDTFPGLFDEENLWGPTAAREEPRRTNVFDDVKFIQQHDILIHEIRLDDYQTRWKLFKRWYDECCSRAATASGLTVRHAAQQLGTEVVRALNPDAWWQLSARIAFELLVGRASYDRTLGIDRSKPVRHHAVAIPDGRFSDEIIGIRQAGGVVVKLVGRTSGQVGNAGHSSETSLDTIPDSFYDFIVDNSGSREDLRAQLRQVVEWFQPCQTMTPDRLRRRMG